MSPTPDAIAAIRSCVAALAGGWAGNDDAAIVAALNAPSIANPATQPTVPVPFGLSGLLAHVDAAAAANLLAVTGLDTLIAQANAGDVAACAHWVALLQLSGKITADQATALAGVVAATQPDPSWTPQISWARAHLGRDADPADVAAARSN